MEFKGNHPVKPLFLGKLHGKSAITLIELLIVVALISFLVGAIGSIFYAGSRIFYNQWSRTGIKGEVSRAFLSLSQELRQSTSVVTATATTLSFTLDSDNDGVNETLQYSWSGTAGNPLNRTVVLPAPSYTTPAVSTVQSLAFSYYDGSNNLLGLPVTVSQVKRVDMNITVADRDETFTLNTTQKLRNL